MNLRFVRAPFNNVVIHTGHDVRTIPPCALCRGLGHRDAMLSFDAEGSRRYTHGRCHIQMYGWEHFFRLLRNQAAAIDARRPGRSR